MGNLRLLSLKPHSSLLVSKQQAAPVPWQVAAWGPCSAAAGGGGHLLKIQKTRTCTPRKTQCFSQSVYLRNSQAALDSQLEEMIVSALPLAARDWTHDFGKIAQKSCGTYLEPFHVSAVATVMRSEIKT